MAEDADDEIEDRRTNGEAHIRRHRARQRADVARSDAVAVVDRLPHHRNAGAADQDPAVGLRSPAFRRRSRRLAPQPRSRRDVAIAHRRAHRGRLPGAGDRHRPVPWDCRTRRPEPAASRARSHHARSFAHLADKRIHAAVQRARLDRIRQEPHQARRGRRRGRVNSVGAARHAALGDVRRRRGFARASPLVVHEGDGGGR